jgi:hypothetical protein
MRNLPSTTGSFSYGETSWTAGDLTKIDAGKAAEQDLIAKANSVPLFNVLRYYNVRITPSYVNSTICPFKHHKGGRERTGSFYFYPETNSFYCHGCKTGGMHRHAVAFVAAYEGITFVKAAQKIIGLFGSDVDPLAEFSDDRNYSEQLEIMMDFSNAVREFRKNYLDDESQYFIENACAAYDELNSKHDMDNDSLRSLIFKLKEQIDIRK